MMFWPDRAEEEEEEEGVPDVKRPLDESREGAAAFDRVSS